MYTAKNLLEEAAVGLFEVFLKKISGKISEAQSSNWTSGTSNENCPAQLHEESKARNGKPCQGYPAAKDLLHPLFDHTFK